METLPHIPSELQVKLSKMRSLLDQHGADGLLLRRVSSFAWATCGAASYVNTAATEGAASLLVTRHEQMVITNPIEAPRLEQEEALAEQGWEMKVFPWTSLPDGLAQVTAGLRLVSDVPYPGAKDVSAEIARLRASLTPQEGERFTVLAGLCAQAMQAAALAVRPGQRETEIAALLGSEAQQRGVQPVVNLIATDERIYRYRHPLPTGKELVRYVMLVLCGRQHGLVCSITRLVHFGKLPASLEARIRAAADVNAVFVAHTRPGARLGEIFRLAQQEYADRGFPDEWRRHHQGGPAGYEPREYLGLPESSDMVSQGQVYAWNPSVAGAKVEDTILVGERSNQILTATPGWPVEYIRVAGHPGEGQPVEIACPLALEIH